MSESLREKSNKRILVLANNDVGLYRFRKDLLVALLGAGHEVYISLPDGGFFGSGDRFLAFCPLFQVAFSDGFCYNTLHQRDMGGGSL